MTTKRKIAFATAACAVAWIWMSAQAAERPETLAFPFRESVTSGGTYAAGETVGTNFVVSGEISSALAFSGSVPYRVTLSDATITKAVTLSGDAQLWLEGENSIKISGATAIASTGSLTVGGTGSLSLASTPTKKQTGPIVAENLTIAGGSIEIALNADVKNVAGITLTGDYKQLAGNVSIDCQSFGATNKVNGILVNKKNKSVTISGGLLAVLVCGEKSVAISLDKSGTTMALNGGVVALTVAGDGAKGIKGDETFTMTGGLLNASVTGGVLYENCEAGDGTNYVVNITSSSSLLSSTGAYVVQDTSPAYAVKCGNIDISGGTVRVNATGVSARGLCADADGGTFKISGGFFDITCSGAASDTVLEFLDETALTTEIDKSTACALRTSETNSTFTITGGTLNLVASGTGGKCIVAKGEMVIGKSSQTTLPSNSAFCPDIQAATYGTQVYVAAQKQKNYLSVGTATTTTDISSAKYAKDYIKSGSGENVDYSNPKCIKAEGNLTMHDGRIRGFSQAEGGEGFESKKTLTINGGVFEATTYDDCINASESVVINGGYLYCGATNNDCIDSNGSGSNSVVINGGIVLCFTAATPEVGIDTDNSSGLQFNGGTIVSFGSATDMAYGSSGTLKTYRSTSVSASTYAGKYLKMTGGSKTVYVKVPSMSSTSGSLSLVCTTDGCTSSSPTVSAASSAAGSTSQNFHEVYFQ